MKELEQIHKDKVEVSAQAEIPVKSEKKIATTNPHAGHSVFKMNLENFLVSSLEEDDYHEYYNFRGAKTTKVVVKQGYIYCTALNKKNAIKKFCKKLHSMGVTIE
jgi:hypothetical protein